MSRFEELYAADLKRYGDHIDKYEKKFLYLFRKVTTSENKLMSYYYRWRYSKFAQRNGNEISRTSQIGKGLYIGHPYCITVNYEAKLGENVNLHKGVTIGQENRGPRAGAPTIGNQVWIGINATVVGKVTIGDDVLIGPNTVVNCDVPPHSIVVGNPCKIIPREHATEGYCDNLA